MNQRTVMFAWLASAILLAIFAGTPWSSVVLSPEAGGQLIEVTGYMAFPVASALILLQGSAILASFFTPVQVGKALAGGVAMVMIWHFITVSMTLGPSIGSSIEENIEAATGVSGAIAQQDLVASASESVLWAPYLLAVLINILILATKALMRLQASPSKVQTEPVQVGVDLWDAQK
ncbi:MAG: hypothetical protein RLZZ610_467 [Actinomycetota bacterium]